MDRLRLIQLLFDESAARYERDIVPVLAPLTADLIAYAAPQPTDRALDVGTGTGLVARLLAPYARQVIGLDISAGALHTARHIPTAHNVHYLRADIHDLPLAAARVTLAVASFGLNATDPARSLRALRHVIAPGGRLVIQEWGPAAPVDLALDEALADHALDEPGERVERLRAGIAAHPARWQDQLQDVDDYTDWLEDSGFAIEAAAETAPVTIRLPAPEVYLRFKLAWTDRFEEVQAMDVCTRADFYTAARSLLARYAGPDGAFVWQPVVFRVTARRR
ncbi:MAG: methyltransferase domain-containing protein [Chloroflexi bacterium]|nr:methyltransferase domain-containing protein [Chloroflexota bacterium]